MQVITIKPHVHGNKKHELGEEYSLQNRTAQELIKKGFVKEVSWLKRITKDEPKRNKQRRNRTPRGKGNS